MRIMTVVCVVFATLALFCQAFAFPGADGVSSVHEAAVSHLTATEFDTDFDTLLDKYVQKEWHDMYTAMKENNDFTELLEVAVEAQTNTHAQWPSVNQHPRFKRELNGQRDAEMDAANAAAAAGQSSTGAAPDAAGAVPPVSTSSSAGGADSALVGGCEVCVYVIENKQQHQPYLCRGLKDPNYQKACVAVMESLMWWLTNQVYWNNYGCQRTMNGAVEWVRPCPAHAVCSWIEHLYSRRPFCPTDPYYKKPQ